MRIRLVLSSLLGLWPAIGLTQLQVVGDDACPKYAVDIASFASCDGDRIAAAASLPPVQALPLHAVPPRKRSAAGLHVDAAQAHRLRQAYPERVALIDVRGRLEAEYAGQPQPIDLHVPYVEPSPETTGGAPRLQRNPAFVDEVARGVAERGLAPDDVVLLICRSGEVSAIAADALAAAGLSRVYTVVDGFEGDLGAGGRRDVNGWKNAGALWQARPLAQLPGRRAAAAALSPQR